MRYRSEIDGLRTVAVMSVLLHHAEVPGFHGGYVGVDVFFVISGFLITTILIRELDEGRYSLLSFYDRRARRILPALFTVVLVCLPFAWALMVPFQLQDFAQSVAATVGFASNVLFYFEAGYFEPEASLKPLLHTWSLAVEEQYYLVIPLVLAGLHRFGARVALAGCFALAAVSFGYCLYLQPQDPSASFFLPFSRAWELLAGTILAFLCRDGRALGAGPVAEVLALTGLALVVAAIVGFDSRTPFPSSWALAPVLGTCLLIGYSERQTLVGRFLSLRPMVFIGLISYSTYLWHQPILVFARLELGDLSWGVKAGAIISSLVLATITWWLIERPARNRALLNWRVFAGLIGGVAGVLVLLGVAGHKTNGFYEAKLAALPADARDSVISRRAETARVEQFQAGLGRPTWSRPFDQDNRRKVLILGDSVSAGFMATLSGAPQYFGHLSLRWMRLDDECVGVFQDHGALPDTACGKEVRALLDADLLDTADEVVFHAGIQPHNIDDVLTFVRILTETGKPVSVVGNAAFNDLASLSFKAATVDQALEEFFHANWRSKYILLDDRLAGALEEIPGAWHLDKAGLLCDRDAGRCNLLDADGSYRIFDGQHLTIEGYRYMARAIAEAGWFAAP